MSSFHAVVVVEAFKILQLCVIAHDEHSNENESVDNHPYSE